MGEASSLIDKSSRRWAIRAGSFLVPVAHAAGQNVVTVMGLRYLTDNLGMAAGAAGLIFAGVKIYDGFLDPAVGAWSDNARTRWGRRIPFLLAGGFAMPMGLALLFGVPDLGSLLLTQIVVTLALALHASGFTLLTIPGFAMVIESSADPHERTRLMAWRTYGNAVGTLLGSTLPAWMLARIGADRAGHLAMALTVGAVVLLATVLAVRLLAGAPRTVAAPDAPRGIDLARQARLAWANRPFRILALAHVLLLFGTAIRQRQRDLGAGVGSVDRRARQPQSIEGGAEGLGKIGDRRRCDIERIGIAISGRVESEDAKPTGEHFHQRHMQPRGPGGIVQQNDVRARACDPVMNHASGACCRRNADYSLRA